MASIRTRRGKRGESYQVTWRTGGARAGAQQSETFNPADGPHRDWEHADLFRAAVTAAGEQWPENYVPKLGWVTPAQMAAYRAAADGEVPAGPDTGRTVRQFAIEWVESLSGIEPYTRATYRRHLERHVMPAFGDLPVSDTRELSASAVGRWVNALQAGTPLAGDGEDEQRAPLAPKTVRDVHRIFWSVMDAAVHAEPPLRAANPCARTKLPRLDRGEGDEEMVFLTLAEFQTIHGLIEDSDARDLAEWLVGTGMRFHEATAVQVGDLEDLLGADPAVRVKRAWKRDGGHERASSEGGWYLGVPKTRGSRRRIGLTRRQVEMLLPRVAGKRKDELVFTGPDGGRWPHATFYVRRWRPAVYKAVRCEACRARDYAAGIGRGDGLGRLTKAQITPCGCPGVLEKVPRAHDLRHTHVAWLIPTGAPLLAISRRLGHSSIKITQDLYGHLLPEVDRHMVAGLQAMMGQEPAVRV